MTGKCFELLTSFEMTTQIRFPSRCSTARRCWTLFGLAIGFGWETRRHSHCQTGSVWQSSSTSQSDLGYPWESALRLESMTATELLSTTSSAIESDSMSGSMTCLRLG